MLVGQNRRKRWIQPLMETHLYHLDHKNRVHNRNKTQFKQIFEFYRLKQKRNRTFLQEIERENQCSSKYNSLITKRFKEYSLDGIQDFTYFYRNQYNKNVVLKKQQSSKRMKSKDKKFQIKKTKKYIKYRGKKNNQRTKVDSSIQTNKNSIQQTTKPNILSSALARMQKVLRLYQIKLNQLLKQKEYYRLQWKREKKRQN